MSSTTINAWQRPLAFTSPSPSQPPQSGWVALEKTPKEKDTAKLIQKANDQATLLLELLKLGDKPSSLEELRENEILQQVYKSCQDYSTDLAERVAEDDDINDDNSPYYFDAYKNRDTFSTTVSPSSTTPHPSSSTSSSSSHGPHITAKETQIAALLMAIEALQVAFKEFNELQDYLHAKQLQSVEDYYATETGNTTPTPTKTTSKKAYKSRRMVTPSAPVPNPWTTSSSLSSTSNSNAAAHKKLVVAHPFPFLDENELLEDEEEDDDEGDGHDDEGEEEDDDDEHVTGSFGRTPRSQQPIEYKLDPRPDYRANQQRLKSGKVSAERMEARQERAREKVTVDPAKILIASLRIEDEEDKKHGDETEKKDVEEEKEQEKKEQEKRSEEAEATEQQQEPLQVESHLVEEVMPVAAETVDDDLCSHQPVEEDPAYLSDDSWQEVADEAVDSALVEEEEAIESSSSSIIVVQPSEKA
ncbi:hypothetical protein DFQ26_007068 [Actinomortierella ambigua]|nr:hypothetical protein DFQ26_007068 [Actinomortierella ambigua]